MRISAAVVNNLGVRTAAATRTAIARRAATVGYVEFDERRMRRVLGPRRPHALEAGRRHAEPALRHADQHVLVHGVGPEPRAAVEREGVSYNFV